MSGTLVDRRDRISLALLGAMCVLPFVQPSHLRPFMHFESEWLAIALGLMFAALQCLRAQASPPRATGLLLLAAAWMLLQGWLLPQTYGESSLQPALVTAWAGGVFAAACLLAQRLGPARVAQVLAGALLAGALINAAVAYVQVLGVPEWARLVIWQDPDAAGARVILPGGNVRHRGHLALQLGLGVLALAWLHARGRAPFALALGGTLWLVGALVLTTQRAGLLYLLVPLSLCPLLWSSACRDAGRIAAVSVCAIVSFAALQPVLPDLFHRDTKMQTSALDRVRNDADASGVGIRLPLYATAWDMFLAAPLTGQGADAFTAWHDRRNAGRPAYLYTTHAHNQFLFVLAAFGLIGAVPLAWLCLQGLWRARLTVRDPLRCFPCAALSMLGAACMIEVPLSFAYFLGPAAALLALAADWPRLAPPPRAARAGLASLAVAGALMLGWAAQGYAQMVAPWLQPMGRDATVAQFRRAQANPLMRPLADSVLADLIVLDRTDIDGKRRLNARTVAWRPAQRPLWREAALAALAGEAAAADAAFDRALQAFPRAAASFMGHLCSGARAQEAALLELARRAALRHGLATSGACSG